MESGPASAGMLTCSGRSYHGVWKVLMHCAADMWDRSVHRLLQRRGRRQWKRRWPSGARRTRRRITDTCQQRADKADRASDDTLFCAFAILRRRLVGICDSIATGVAHESGVLDVGTTHACYMTSDDLM